MGKKCGTSSHSAEKRQGSSEEDLDEAVTICSTGDTATGRQEMGRGTAWESSTVDMGKWRF